jgi:flagellar motor switch protein FliN/FliY
MSTNPAADLPGMGQAFDALLEVELPVTIRFGTCRMRLEEAAKLQAGSLIEFDRSPAEPVEVMVNGRVIARGQAVNIEGNYGVRILEISAGRESLKSNKIPDGDRQAAQDGAKGATQ